MKIYVETFAQKVIILLQQFFNWNIFHFRRRTMSEMKLPSCELILMKKIIKCRNI